MIKDTLKNFSNYSEITENIINGLNFLKTTDFNKISDGKHALSGDDFVNLQTYTTKSDADFEAHRNYIDIQYIISGKEIIEVTEYNTCKEKIKYNGDNDIEFLSGNGTAHEIREGEFMILYPNDAHKPSISIDKNAPDTVRKAVVKIKI